MRVKVGRGQGCHEGAHVHAEVCVCGGGLGCHESAANEPYRPGEEINRRKRCENVRGHLRLSLVELFRVLGSESSASLVRELGESNCCIPWLRLEFKFTFARGAILLAAIYTVLNIL